MTTLAIDLAVVAIIVFCGWRGYKNGLIRGVFGVVTLIVALVLANIAASAYSEEVTGALQPFVGGIIDSAMTKILDGDVTIEYVEDASDAEGFSMAYTALREVGLPVPAAINVADLAVGDYGVGDSLGFLTELVSERLSSTLSYVALFGIAFLLASIIFAVIGNLIGFVFSLPGLKLVDIIAGAALGLAKGFLIVLSLAAVVRYFGLLAQSTLEETTVLNYFVNNNMIADMLGI